MSTENLGNGLDCPISALQARHPKVSSSIFDYDDYLYLASLSVKDSEQRKGYGTSFMKDLCKFADDEGLDIELSPSESADDPEYCQRLVSFYEKFGFNVTSEEDCYMLRQSRSA